MPGLLSPGIYYWRSLNGRLSKSCYYFICHFVLTQSGAKVKAFRSFHALLPTHFLALHSNTQSVFSFSPPENSSDVNILRQRS